jgi:hypothetical protein
VLILKVIFYWRINDATNGGAKVNDGHVLGVVLAAEDLVVPDEAGVLVGQQQVADRTSDRQGGSSHTALHESNIKTGFVATWNIFRGEQTSRPLFLMSFRQIAERMYGFCSAGIRRWHTK